MKYTFSTHIVYVSNHHMNHTNIFAHCVGYCKCFRPMIDWVKGYAYNCSHARNIPQISKNEHWLNAEC